MVNKDEYHHILCAELFFSRTLYTYSPIALLAFVVCVFLRYFN